MSSSRRVVLTGLGVVTPIGTGLPDFRQSLNAGRSGIGPIRSFDASALPVRIAAEIEDFDARLYVDKKDRKSLKMMVRTIQLTVAGAKLAVEDARLDPDKFDPTRFGVVFGTGCIPGDLTELGLAACGSLDPASGHIDLRRWGTGGIPTIPPMWMLNHVPNMPASHVSILQNAQGPNNTVTISDAAGLLALGEAVRVIQRNAADVMLTGGGDARTAPLVLIRHCLFSELSRRNEEPTRASRPFERRRDGQVLGEGAGVMLLEDLEHARRRQVSILAEVVGFASAFDPKRSGRGLARAIHMALAEAKITPADLDHVNAHAAGTVEGDAWEARSLREALGEKRVPVLAMKSCLGNLGTAAGPVELISSLLALRDGTVPPTLNQEEPDPACPVWVPREPRQVRRPYVLKISCTERGQCAALVVRRWD
jgi:3-oxoacyl-[acyl-carrier-protein] synthase II